MDITTKVSMGENVFDAIIVIYVKASLGQFLVMIFLLIADLSYASTCVVFLSCSIQSALELTMYQ